MEYITYHYETVHGHMEYKLRVDRTRVPVRSCYPTPLVRQSMEVCLEAVLGLREAPS